MEIIRAIKQRCNDEQQVTARFELLYYNSKIDPKKSQTLESHILFLPYPEVAYNENIVPISKYGARDFIKTYDSLPPEVKDCFSSLLPYINVKA